MRTIALLALFAATSAPIAFAQSVHGSGGGFSGSGTLVTTDNGDGSYTIDSLSGDGIGGLIDTGSFHGNDNLLFPSDDSVVDGSGFSFTDTQGDTGFSVDVFSSNGSYFAYIDDSDEFTETLPVTLSLSEGTMPEYAAATVNARGTGEAIGGATVDFTFSVAPQATIPSTPEPSSLLLLGTGILGIAGAIRWRFARA